MGVGFAQQHSVNSKFSPASDRTGDLSLASRARYLGGTTPSFVACSMQQGQGKFKIKKSKTGKSRRKM